MTVKLSTGLRSAMLNGGVGGGVGPGGDLPLRAFAGRTLGEALLEPTVIYVRQVLRLIKQHPIKGLADSKALSPRRRERLYDEIRAKALCCSVAEASVEEIDRLNILQATLLAMCRAVEGLRLRPQCVLVDGNRAPSIDLPVRCVIGGDATVPEISAASIVSRSRISPTSTTSGSWRRT